MVLADPGRGPSDPTRIDINEAAEIRWWCSKFGCTEEVLRVAVQSVGPKTADVERRLKEAAKQVFKNTGED